MQNEALACGEQNFCFTLSIHSHHPSWGEAEVIPHSRAGSYTLQSYWGKMGSLFLWATPLKAHSHSTNLKKQEKQDGEGKIGFDCRAPAVEFL